MNNRYSSFSVSSIYEQNLLLWLFSFFHILHKISNVIFSIIFPEDGSFPLLLNTPV